ncbi:MAG: helix-turn-helix transcriptional regulator [Candidatus Omnitrophica bacterium]|nr:helix-turn-helix transcriptional regulator [Candidatus Omnitrophota bacterium]
MLKIGNRIRDLRKAKKVTLIDLAKQTGIAQATLSRIETGQMTGTVESHRKIAEALGLSLAELYAPLDRRYDEVALSKQETPHKVVHQSRGCQIELLTQEVTKKKITPLLLKLSGNAKTTLERGERGVEKFLWVLEGEVELGLEKESYSLKQGDSIYFDASIPHRLSNPKSKAAEVFIAVSPSKI